MWKMHYGDGLKYVGIDIDPRCARTASAKEDIFVEIGSQLDSHFLDEVCAKHGPFDAIIDDGGHTFNMIKASLTSMFLNPNCLHEDSWYVVEDLHVMAMCKDGFCRSSIEHSQMFSSIYAAMHSYWGHIDHLDPSLAKFHGHVDFSFEWLTGRGLSCLRIGGVRDA